MCEKHKNVDVSGGNNSRIEGDHILNCHIPSPRDDIKKSIARFEHLQTYKDTEIAHIEADEEMVSLLKRIGLGDLAEAYEKIGKWYL
jgi:hypothetical protein